MFCLYIITSFVIYWIVIVVTNSQNHFFIYQSSKNSNHNWFPFFSQGSHSVKCWQALVHSVFGGVARQQCTCRGKCILPVSWDAEDSRWTCEPVRWLICGSVQLQQNGDRIREPRRNQHPDRHWPEQVGFTLPMFLLLENIQSKYLWQGYTILKICSINDRKCEFIYLHFEMAI